jgi:hypothetical protein
MHAKLLGCFALVAFVVPENLKDVAPLKLPNRVSIGDSGAVHLNNKTV